MLYTDCIWIFFCIFVSSAIITLYWLLEKFWTWKGIFSTFAIFILMWLTPKCKHFFANDNWICYLLTRKENHQEKNCPHMTTLWIFSRKTVFIFFFRYRMKIAKKFLLRFVRLSLYLIVIQEIAKQLGMASAKEFKMWNVELLTVAKRIVKLSKHVFVHQELGFLVIDAH